MACWPTSSACSPGTPHHRRPGPPLRRCGATRITSGSCSATGSARWRSHPRPTPSECPADRADTASTTRKPSGRWPRSTPHSHLSRPRPSTATSSPSPRRTTRVLRAGQRNWTSSTSGLSPALAPRRSERAPAMPTWASVTGYAVDPLPDEVGVAVVACVLLDHVQVDPANVEGALWVVAVAGHDIIKLLSGHGGACVLY